MELDDTVMLPGAGTPEAPAARLNERAPADKTRFGLPAAAITVRAADVTVSAGDSESVMVMEKLKAPLAEGVPEISPLASVKPGGNEPLPTAKV